LVFGTTAYTYTIPSPTSRSHINLICNSINNILNIVVVFYYVNITHLLVCNSTWICHTLSHTHEVFDIVAASLCLSVPQHEEIPLHTPILLFVNTGSLIVLLLLVFNVYKFPNYIYLNCPVYLCSNMLNYHIIYRLQLHCIVKLVCYFKQWTVITNLLFIYSICLSSNLCAYWFSF